MTSRTAAIETAGVTRAFGTVRAVDGLDLWVPAGSVYGLLGPNGAGKTTAIRILATLLRPDSGIARVLGHDVTREPAAVRAKISLTGQFASTDEDLTARENLVLLARLLGYSRSAARARTAQLLAAFGLTGTANRQVKHFSGGMRRRLDIAASVVITPDLLFLDEPTTGLDPYSRSQVWETIRAVASDGTTVLLTTQYLDEADQLADRIAVMNHGKVIAEGTASELKASIGSSVLQVRLQDTRQRAEAERVLWQALGVAAGRGSGEAVLSARVAAADAGGGVDRVTRALAELSRAGVVVAGFSLGQPSLDEVFLTVTGHESHAAGAGKDAR